ncbi:MAG TPA: hypothetical protein VLF90_02795 [Patescibacteria group bacterium]|nr:hypothetical protein [Patescibacteria group bacterium]
MKNALVIGIIVAIFGLVIGLYIRRRAVAFAGKVVDKDVREQVNNNYNQNQTGNQGFSNSTGGITNGSNVTHQYMIKVLTDAGKTFNWQVSQGKYEIIKIGDHVTKAAGTTDVEITPQAPSPPATNIPAPLT